MRYATASIAGLCVALIATSASLEASRRFTSAGVFAVPGAGTGATDGAPAFVYPVSIQVSGAGGTIRNVRLSFSLTHAFVSDVDVVLVAPGGQSLVVMSDAGGSTAANNVQFTFSDGAAAALPSSTTLTSGAYRPTNYFTGDVFPAPGPAAPSNPAPAGTATFASVFGGLSPNGTWKVFVVDDNSGDTGGIGNFELVISTTLDPDAVVADLDGDNVTDWSIKRGLFSAGPVTWFTSNSDGVSVIPWGSSAVHPLLMTADMDGDGTSDLVACGPMDDAATPATCWVRLHSGAYYAQRWGALGDNYDAFGDFDGDGATDLGVYRNGTWYALASASQSLLGVHFGLGTDHPKPADVDGDGRTDFVVVRNEAGGASTVYQLASRAGFQAIAWGLSTDYHTTGDYDGDGLADHVALRGSASGDPYVWYVRRSSDGGLTAVAWGTVDDDVPVTGDYDHDGKCDIGVYRFHEGTFYIRKSSDGSLLAIHWGLFPDMPTAIVR